MDWRYAIFTAEQGVLGIAPLLAAGLVLLAAASQGRRLVACSPPLAALVAFAVSCVVAGLPGVEHRPLIGYLPLLGPVLAAVFVVPSILSLRNKWLGLVHLLTLAGVLLTSFVGAMAIAHDWL